MQCESPQIDPGLIAEAILGAAGWARVGITMPTEDMRRKAAQELAATIVEQLAAAPQIDPRQLGLFA